MKNILIGITGGIAAYKICELVRMYKRANYNVQVVLTPNATNFVTPLTLQTLSKNPVNVDSFNQIDYKPEHISLADWADIFVIAPATANTISKIANGIADNLLTSLACAFSKPMIIAPAMNCNMYENKFVQENITKLKNTGYHFCNPETGYLACDAIGNGRLCDIQKIFDKTEEILNSKKKLKNKKITITSGGTIEEIDTVRYISNYSSGKMGASLAKKACDMGAEVILITTKDFDNTDYPQIKVLKVKSALEMQKEVEKAFKKTDVLIMAAAVADYRAKNIADHKMKKTSKDTLSIELVKNPDILKEICEKKTKKQIVIGFCAESENLLKNAKEKISKKGCDYLIANDISRKDIGFSSDYNEIHILDKNGNIEKIDKATKDEIASKILEKICK